MNKIITIDTDEDILRNKSEKVYNLKSVKSTIEDMKKALLGNNNAIGLAAPQIGINKRIVLFKEFEYDDDDNKENYLKKIICLINPTIVKKYGEVTGYESCLSVPGIEAYIKRAERIVVKDETGMYNFKSISAIIVQHEMDHLDGILITDRAITVEKRE